MVEKPADPPIGDPPLSGIVVADFSRVLAGPLASMTLGDLGAEVIKVERPGSGDDTRAWGPPWHGADSTYYLGLNRNKRSIVLDLEDGDDRAIAARLAARADVLIENFRPGTMDRFGLGYQSVAASSPGVVYCTISGFGTDGDAADLPGYDFLVQAMSGLMSITGAEGGEPTKVGVAVVDMICGLYATIGILAALRERAHNGGTGQRLTVSLFDAALAGLLNQASGYLLGGMVPGRLGNRHPSIAPYQVVRTGDRPIAIAVGSDRLWARMCAVVGLDDLVEDPRYRTNADRVANVDALIDEIEAVLRTREGDYWIRELRAVGVPAGPINDVGEAFAFATELGLEPTVGISSADGDQIRTVRSPIRLERTPPVVRLPPPSLGEHSAEIRKWLAAETGGTPGSR